MNLEKIIKLSAFGIVFILLITFLVMLLGEDQDAVKVAKDSKAVGFGFGLTYTLFALAIIAVLTLAIVGLVNKPKSLIVIGIGIGAIILFYFVGYGIDGGELPESFTKGGIITTESASKKVGGVLNATLFVIVIIVAVSVISSIRDIINKING